jgi:hypothetical protein
VFGGFFEALIEDPDFEYLIIDSTIRAGAPTRTPLPKRANDVGDVS